MKNSIKIISGGVSILSINKSVIIGLLITSVALICTVIIWAIVRAIRSRFSKERHANRIILYLFLFIFSIWCLRYAVGYYKIFFPDEGAKPLSVTEELFNSLVHTFQTFSMDEDYTEYITNGKEMMKLISNDNSFLVNLYGFYASFVNILAPICGGAILLSILQSVFPCVQLFFCRLAFWKKKYYFSELNERSLASAKSIFEQKHALFCSPVLIFTDAYTDDEDENSSELRLKAKEIGAICLTDDLTRFNHRFTLQKEYWLMDEIEINNIKKLAELSDEKHYKSIRRTIIRIFYQNDSYALTEREICEQIRDNFRKDISERRISKKKRTYSKDLYKHAVESLEGKNKPSPTEDEISRKMTKIQDIRKKAAKESLEEQGVKNITDELIVNEILTNELLDIDAPAVIRTRCYQNLVYNLLREIPLYSPLIDRPEASELNVAIIGNGNIGIEMFRATYWCGQLLDIPLSINMVSKDSVEDACAKIDQINTDILLSTQKESSMLALYPNAKQQKHNDPYFTFRYCQADVDFENVESIRCVIPEKLRNSDKHGEMALPDADYYMVALGSDDANLRMTEALCKEIAAEQIKSGSMRKVVVTYVIYDADLCRTLNAHKNRISDHIEMRAIGGLDQVYSCSNIYMESVSDEAKDTNERYREISRSEWIKTSNLRSKKAYDFWSSSARSIHYTYKVFSAYAYSHKNKMGKAAEQTWDEWKKAHSEYICEDANDELAQLLGWLEHRRWNAYMRSLGFKFSDNKDIILKLHYCLIECKKRISDSAMDDYLDVAAKKYDPRFKEYDMEHIVKKQ